MSITPRFISRSIKAGLPRRFETSTPQSRARNRPRIHCNLHAILNSEPPQSLRTHNQYPTRNSCNAAQSCYESKASGRMQSGAIARPQSLWDYCLVVQAQGASKEINQSNVAAT